MGTLRHPVTTSEARSGLTATVRRFREQGAAAEPVLFGSHRKPEAVILPYEAYETLRTVVEDLAIAVELRDRDASDDGTRYTFADVADELGVDLEAL
ncbi:hypothetical protein BH23ACT10_BH23ACT10_13420 [soil metagenome]